MPSAGFFFAPAIVSSIAYISSAGRTPSRRESRSRLADFIANLPHHLDLVLLAIFVHLGLPPVKLEVALEVLPVLIRYVFQELRLLSLLDLHHLDVLHARGRPPLLRPSDA